MNVKDYFGIFTPSNVGLYLCDSIVVTDSYGVSIEYLNNFYNYNVNRLNSFYYKKNFLKCNVFSNLDNNLSVKDMHKLLKSYEGEDFFLSFKKDALKSFDTNFGKNQKKFYIDSDKLQIPNKILNNSLEADLSRFGLYPSSNFDFDIFLKKLNIIDKSKYF